jgi:pectate lyase
MNDVASNKTIVGVGYNGVIEGGGFDIDGVDNVIVRNLMFRGADDDAINVQDGSTNVWITHCEFTDASDGLVDIKRGSDYITVSWNYFCDHDHTCLLGHSNDNGDQDRGHLRVTYHHNWFDNTESRHPRVRFSALTHVYNNYYVGNNYGVASTMDAEVLVEGNYFQDVDSPTLVGYGSSDPGDLVEQNNVYDGSGSPETQGSVPSPSYSYSMDDADSVPSIVSGGAGRNGEE